MNKNQFVSTLNEWGAQRIPFFFIVDFEMEKPILHKIESVDPAKILFDINGFTNINASADISPSILSKHPLSFPEYDEKFRVVYDHLAYGDSYLTNLTVKTEVNLSHGLRDTFLAAKAKYKLLVEDKFLVFSPECFVRIAQGRIFSFPMKGTIDASMPNARNVIIEDMKELAEHVTIVDLIRNDLSQVADHVEVTRFRYIDEIRTKDRNLLQVSSEIAGSLPNDYHMRLGDIFCALLPAGSVSGAPKPKTLQIIRNAEKEKRGFYTGVFGYFNGEQLDSGVMIRFIENDNGRFFYRSGGGITTQSVAEKEYQEIIDKVYVPVD